LWTSPTTAGALSGQISVLLRVEPVTKQKPSSCSRSVLVLSNTTEDGASGARCRSPREQRSRRSRPRCQRGLAHRRGDGGDRRPTVGADAVVPAEKPDPEADRLSHSCKPALAGLRASAGANAIVCRGSIAGKPRERTVKWEPGQLLPRIRGGKLDDRLGNLCSLTHTRSWTGSNVTRPSGSLDPAYAP
jgi:hypothetical protein